MRRLSPADDAGCRARILDERLFVKSARSSDGINRFERVVSGDVGGNFGNNTYSELALVAWAARRVGRPVKWSCERRDAFAADFHGRDLTSEAELALDEHGCFLAIRAVNPSNLGASAISFVPLAKGIAVSSSVYDIPCSSSPKPPMRWSTRGDGSPGPCSRRRSRTSNLPQQRFVIKGTDRGVGLFEVGSFLDYALPRADLLPAFDTGISEVPSTTNPLGMWGGSEGGITPGLAAVANAIVDALAEFGVEHNELPAEPERTWNEIRAERREGARPQSKLRCGGGERATLGSGSCAIIRW